jgi:hypothetical protein
LDYRPPDTKVIRAVYERLQSDFGSWLPIRASDELEGTFQLHPQELEDLITDIANHCGRSLEALERNPYYGKLTTVSELIEFLCVQPKAERSDVRNAWIIVGAEDRTWADAETGNG